MDRIAIVGASLAGLEAAKTLRQHGFTGEIAVIGAEAHPPYDRPPLTKELLRGTFTTADIVLDHGPAVDVTWRLGTAVTRLSAAARTLRVGDGPDEAYDGIVIATGATALRPALHRGPREPAGIHVVRTLDDALALAAELRAQPGRVLVVGGGFLGAEVASTSRALGLDVTVVEGLSGPMVTALGEPVAAALATVMRDHGVDLRLRTTVTDVQGGDRVESVGLSDGSVLAADVVVLAVGVRPTTEWLHGSGLTLDGGVLCDETGLAAPGIVAAGDVARWPNRRYGFHDPRRVEHWDNALRQARHVALRLIGEPTPYQPVPWFWSDQFGQKLQLLGSAHAYDEFRVVSGSLESQRFVGLYRRADRVVAAVTLNAAKSMLTCRRLLDGDANWTQALAAFSEVPVLAAPSEGSLR